jgi:hypothetical protein
MIEVAKNLFVGCHSLAQSPASVIESVIASMHHEEQTMSKPRAAAELITIDRLRELLHYNPDTGIFTWRVTRSRKAKAGTQAGSLHTRRLYVVIRIEQQNYAAHRLAWAYVHGQWPLGDLDHVSMDYADNRIANLRPASRSENMGNTKPHRDNACGLKGANFDSRRGRWVSYIMKDGHHKWLGYFDTAEQAHTAYCEEAARLFGTFARAA